MDVPADTPAGYAFGFEVDDVHIEDTQDVSGLSPEPEATRPAEDGEDVSHEIT